jgi:hypothetical protein
MTNFNDGNWHGWNGGECPVHPKSEVRIWDATSGQDLWIPAEAVHWAFCGAFRVAKEYREPREWWLRLDRRGEVTGTDVVVGAPPPNWDSALTIKVREVVE